MRYKKKVREYQADYDQQKSITEVRKQKEEEAQSKMSAIEKELLMSPQDRIYVDFLHLFYVFGLILFMLES